MGKVEVIGNYRSGDHTLSIITGLGACGTFHTILDDVEYLCKFPADVPGFIIANYDTREQAVQGHAEWVAKMTGDAKPAEVRECDDHTWSAAKDAEEGGTDWRMVKRCVIDCVAREYDKETRSGIATMGKNGAYETVVVNCHYLTPKSAPDIVRTMYLTGMVPNVIVVEEYTDRAAAEEGHKRWTAELAGEKLPVELWNVSTSPNALQKDTDLGNEWRINEYAKV
jgi:hypothetical protein